MPAVDLQSRPRRNPDSSFNNIAGEGGLVVLPGKAEVKVVNPVGISVFALLDGHHTVEQIVDAVCEEYETDRRTATEDVAAFLAQLEEHGMLAGGPTGGQEDPS